MYNLYKPIIYTKRKGKQTKIECAEATKQRKTKHPAHPDHTPPPTSPNEHENTPI